MNLFNRKKQTKLKNIPFWKYFTLTDKSTYDYAMKFSYTFKKVYDALNVGDLTEKEFGMVKELQNEFSQELTWPKLIELSSRLLNITQKQFAKYGIIEICQHTNYLRAEIERINEIETQLLTTVTDNDDLTAGIERFAKYKAYPQIRQIATTFNILPEQAEKMRYDVALIELAYQKDYNEYESELMRLKRNKGKYE